MIANDARLTPPRCKKHTAYDDTRLTPHHCKKHTASFACSTGKFPSKYKVKHESLYGAVKGQWESIFLVLPLRQKVTIHQVATC